MFVTEYESFFLNDELEYDVFQLDDLCFASKCAIPSTSKLDFPSTSLDLKPQPNSLKYSFLELDDSFLVLIDLI